MNLSGKKILILGASGLLGSPLGRLLKKKNPSIIYAPKHSEFDLLKPNDVKRLFSATRPDVVFNLFVVFGGIKNNEKRPGSIFYDNLMGNVNIINEAKNVGAEKFIQIGTQCSYPDALPVPFKEEELWNGLPTKNNLPYGIAKRVLLTMLQAYRDEFGFNGIYLVPSNMYGKNDNFHPEHTHVIPALTRRFVDAEEKKLENVELWGDGKSTREFLYNEDAANGVILAAEQYDSGEPINLGTGVEVEISKLGQLIKKITKFKGKIVFNNNGLDGQRRRVNDIEKAKGLFGFTAETSLEQGLGETIKYFKENRNNLREKVYYE